jgi:hypothetical protein
VRRFWIRALFLQRAFRCMMPNGNHNYVYRHPEPVHHSFS